MRSEIFKAKNFMDYELKDDDRTYGGTSCVGETLEDFLYDICDGDDDTVKEYGEKDIREINRILDRCGIEPIMPDIVFDWRRFSKEDYEKFAKNPDFYFGDYAGCVIVGELCFDIRVFWEEGKSDFARIDCYIANENTGYGYITDDFARTKFFPYANCEDYFEVAWIKDIPYEVFRRIVENNIKSFISHDHDENYDMMEKAIHSSFNWYPKGCTDYKEELDY